MSFFGPTDIAQIDYAIQQGRGAAASVLGQTYDVRRLSSTTNNSISANTPVISGLQARVARTTSRAKIENQTFDLLVYTALCNNESLQLQDVCTQTGYGNDGSVFTVVQKRPTRDTLWIRTDENVFISRPFPGAGAASQQPLSGSAATPGYSGFTKATEEVLTLSNGLYSFESSGTTPASLYVGLQQLNKVSDARDPKIPTVLYRERFLIYVPLIPGEQLVELDRINFPNSDRYECASIFSSDLTGVSGNIVIAEKLSN